MSSWTDELKTEVIDKYTSQNPTPENTLDLVADIADKCNVTVNGLRMVLSKAGVYVARGTTAATNASDPTKAKKKSKDESLKELTTLLTQHGVEVDDGIISKLTGKAAEFFIKAFNHLLEDESE